MIPPQSDEQKAEVQVGEMAKSRTTGDNTVGTWDSNPWFQSCVHTCQLNQFTYYDLCYNFSLMWLLDIHNCKGPRKIGGS